MTGRDLILYILANGLEDEPVYKDGKFIGFLTEEEVAIKSNVGTATIGAWIQMGKIESVTVEPATLIPAIYNINGV